MGFVFIFWCNGLILFISFQAVFSTHFDLVEWHKIKKKNYLQLPFKVKLLFSFMSDFLIQAELIAVLRKINNEKYSQKHCGQSYVRPEEEKKTSKIFYLYLLPSLAQFFPLPRRDRKCLQVDAAASAWLRVYYWCSIYLHALHGFYLFLKLVSYSSIYWEQVRLHDHREIGIIRQYNWVGALSVLICKNEKVSRLWFKQSVYVFFDTLFFSISTCVNNQIHPKYYLVQQNGS